MADEKPSPEGNSPQTAEGRAAEVRTLLSQFLAFNPGATVEALDSECCLVTKPWGESGLELFIPPEPSPVYEALNHVRLPGRYSAIWHTDTSDLEIIFTAYKLKESVSDLKGRLFTFFFKNLSFKCGFSASSDRLLAIASQMIRTGQSPTAWRNLESYQDFDRKKNRTDRSSIPEFDPLSFWVEGFEAKNEDEMLEFVQNLNFFMSYHDVFSPRILVHSASPNSESVVIPVRFPAGSFPLEIRGREIDDNLYQFWDASLIGDPLRRFLYSYQVIEYAAGYYIDDEVRSSIKRLLSAPNVNSVLDKSVETIIELLAPQKMNEIQQRGSLLKRCVDPSDIWNEIQKYETYFCSRLEFDGGFVLEPYVTSSQRLVTFQNGWAANFERTIRSIRNALSHGKEYGTNGVISPTVANQARLQPWLGPVALAARQVMLYKNVL